MKVNEILKKYNLKPSGYEKKGKSLIVTTDDGRYVYKEGRLNKEIFDYLKSRNFDYMPKYLTNFNDEYQLMEYVDDFSIPDEQKILDLVHVVALLHSKTTHYKEIDLDYYEQIFDDLNNNLDYLYTYYTDIITLIESKVYMSPYQQLFARNVSVIYKAIDDNKKRLLNWHKHIKEKRKERRVFIHNNLNLSHFFVSDKPYLISWDKAKIASPVFDLYKLYMNHGLDFDFDVLLERYEKYYPLLGSEKELFFILISQPLLIDFKDSEYNNCKHINNMVNMILKTDKFILPKESKDTNK